MNFKFIGCLLLLAGIGFCNGEDRGLIRDEPVVTISQGEVKGKKIVEDDVRVDRFLAIPYAESPTGELRFKPPKPHGGWGSDVFDAGVDLDYKIRDKTCLQITLSQRSTRGSEDCLFLNVWVSGGVEEARKSPLPVMVWIHGGAFILGSSWGANFGDNWLYDQEAMVRHGNVVAVTLNYRLGPFGFLSTGDDASPGNYGLLDQLEALNWVKNNIWAFGGDDKKITIYGESAGGASVSFHMISPLSKDLFNRGISQSGTAFSPWAIAQDPLRWAVEVANEVNCAVDDHSDMMDCLRGADANTLAVAVQLLDRTRDVTMDIPWVPVVDGYFLPDTPETLVANSADKDYLLGHNNMDAHMFAGVDFPAINMDRTPMELNDLKLAATLFDYNVPQKVSDAAVYEYQAYSSQVDEEFYKRAIINLYTDVHFAGPSHNFAEIHDEISGSETSTYLYIFSHPSKMPLLYPQWMGADHADDLQYVFGKPFVSTLVYTREERDISEAFMTYWTNFAWTGNPNEGPNSPPANWLAYTVDKKRYININGSVADFLSSPMEANYRPEAFAFWKKMVPQIKHSLSGDCSDDNRENPGDVKKLLDVKATATTGACPGTSMYERETMYGCVRGENVVWNGITSTRFVGIPYATPPTGSNRFLASSPPQHWTGVRNATKFSPICPQNPFNSTHMDEDCLYLNIYVPVDPNTAADTVVPKKYDVMVWLHGGDYIAGNGGESYRGDILASQHNVIVVTLNYRLGSLGFFTTTDDQASDSNNGVLDQHLALQWIRDNIANFGGNPVNMLLFGQGSGSESVQLHTLSPMSKNIGFDKAILQSGSAMNFQDHANQLDVSQIVAENCGCSSNDTAVMVNCLREKDVESIISAQQQRGDQLKFAPVVDGYFIPDDPTSLMSTELLSQWKFLIGTNSHDGSVHWSDISTIRTHQQFEEAIYDEFEEEFGVRTSDIEFEYTNWQNTQFEKDREDMQSQLMQLYTDSKFTVPSSNLADVVAQAGSGVFLYHFTCSTSQWSPQLAAEFPSWTDAFHGAELGYVWGDVVRDVWLAESNHPEDAALSYEMMKYWTNFAKTGNPNKQSSSDSDSSTQWNPYTADSREYVVFDRIISQSSCVRGKQVEFWNVFLPSLSNIKCSVRFE